MSEQEFNRKSPAWHMEQIRQAIKSAKQLNKPVADLQQERREYFKELSKRTGGMVATHTEAVAQSLAAKNWNAA